MEEKKKIGGGLLVLAALIVFIIAGVKLIGLVYDYVSADREYQSMQEYVVETEAAETEGESGGGENGETHIVGSASEQKDKVSVKPHKVQSVDFAALQKENPDCIGWIQFSNLDISYPIMKGENNDEYLYKTFSGKTRKAGSIFMESVNASDFSDENTFIYGHNMRDNSMFGLLSGYKKESFYKNNPGFTIFTPEGSKYYEIYACYPVAVEGQDDSFRLSFSTKEKYGEFQKTVQERSLYSTGITPTPEQKTVTLMTCTTGGYEHRFLVHAVCRE